MRRVALWGAYGASNQNCVFLLSVLDALSVAATRSLWGGFDIRDLTILEHTVHTFLLDIRIVSLKSDSPSKPILRRPFTKDMEITHVL